MNCYVHTINDNLDYLPNNKLVTLNFNKMNKYVIAVASEEDTWIEVVTARSLNDAEEKLMTRFYNDYDIPMSLDWEDFLHNAIESRGLIFGDFIDVEIL